MNVDFSEKHKLHQQERVVEMKSKSVNIPVAGYIKRMRIVLLSTIGLIIAANSYTAFCPYSWIQW